LFGCAAAPAIMAGRTALLFTGWIRDRLPALDAITDRTNEP
jgi:hypothetical protein